MPVVPVQLPITPPPSGGKKRSALSTVFVIIGAIVLLVVVFGFIGAFVPSTTSANANTGKNYYPDYPTTSQTVYPDYTTTPVPKRHGSISVLTSPGAVQVFVNGQFRGATPADSYKPLVITEIDPGTCSIDLKKSGYIFKSRTVEVKEGQVVSITEELSRVPVRVD